jgi:hypothetical protein
LGVLVERNRFPDGRGSVTVEFVAQLLVYQPQLIL